MANLLGGFGGRGGGLDIRGLSPLQGRRLQELLFKRQQQESNEATQRGYEAIGGRGGEGINTPGALGTKSVGFGRYTQGLNEDVELRTLMAGREGKEGPSSNPVARSGIPGQTFFEQSPQMAVQGGPFSPGGGARPGESAGQTRMRQGQAGRLPAAAGRAFGQQPPSGLEQAATAGEMLGVGGAAQQAGYGAGPAMIRQALQALAGVQKPLNMPAQPGLGGLETTTPSQEVQTNVGGGPGAQRYQQASEGYLGAATTAADQQRQVGEAFQPPVEDPRLEQERIKGQNALAALKQQAEQGVDPQALQADAMKALAQYAQMDPQPGDPILQGLAQLALGELFQPGAGGGGGEVLEFDEFGNPIVR